MLTRSTVSEIGTQKMFIGRTGEWKTSLAQTAYSFFSPKRHHAALVMKNRSFKTTNRKSVAHSLFLKILSKCLVILREKK